MIVIDASYMLDYLLKEGELKNNDNFISLFSTHKIFAPTLLHLEISNTVLMKFNRKAFDFDEILEIIEMFDRFNITFVPDANICSKKELLAFASTHSLTTYDALYLKLTLALNAKIVSFDKKIITAASALGILF